MPPICMPHTFICPHMFVHPQGCTCPPYAPILFYASVFLEALHVVGVVMGSPLCWDTLPYITVFGGASPLLHPQTQSLVPCASVCFRDISMLCGHFPSVRKGLGCFPISWGVGTSALEMFICSFLYLFCSALCLMFQLQL